ncbi:hypothetical protein EVAR_53800_1 [Eumeta japonica]|uniref:Uncharacterized protein n=1 Tax=Eumeta variegata TaxID=151549 RepID=A0A4C1XYM7_EUMVA|nr:hypothetical protein EVAR_53800_1 [Eumeta japonica]
MYDEIATPGRVSAENAPRLVSRSTVTCNGIAIANKTKRKIETRDWVRFEVENGTKNVIDRATKIGIKIVAGIGMRRD